MTKPYRPRGHGLADVDTDLVLAACTALATDPRQSGVRACRVLGGGYYGPVTGYGRYPRRPRPSMGRIGLLSVDPSEHVCKGDVEGAGLVVCKVIQCAAHMARGVPFDFARALVTETHVRRLAPGTLCPFCRRIVPESTR